MSHHLLLRAPADGNTSIENGSAKDVGTQEDPYEKLLQPATSVPLFETVQTLEELQWILETGPAFHGYKGVIVTSKRAVDAWMTAGKTAPAPVDERANWTDIPFYAVGAATANAVRELSNTLPGAPHLVPREVLGAEETGTGEQLAHFILARLADQREAGSPSNISLPGSVSTTNLMVNGSVSTDNLSIFTTNGQESPLGQKIQGSPRIRRASRRPTKLLFLVGDKTRDVLPNILSADKFVELDSVQVYATKPRPEFQADLSRAITTQPKVNDWWVAIFAPSGADQALPALLEHFNLVRNDQSKKKARKSKGSLPTARIAAIGPTTATHLRDKLHLDVDAVAAKPSAEELANAIKAAK